MTGKKGTKYTMRKRQTADIGGSGCDVAGQNENWRISMHRKASNNCHLTI